MFFSGLLFVFLLALSPVSPLFAQPVTFQQAYAQLPPADKAAVDALFYEAVIAQSQANYQQAADQYQALLKKLPQHPVALYNLADILVQDRQASKALPYARAAAVLEPDNVWFARLLATCYEQSREYPKALEVLQKIRLRNPDDIQLLSQLAATYVLAGQPQQAPPIFEAIIQKTGFTEEWVQREWELLVQARNWDLAITELKKYIARDPANESFYFWLFDTCLRNGRKDQAEQALLALLKQNPMQEQGLFELLQLYDEQRRLTDAEPLLERWFQQANSGPDLRVRYLRSLLPYRSEAVMATRIDKWLPKLATQFPRSAAITTLQSEWRLSNAEATGGQALANGAAEAELRQLVEENPANRPGWDRLLKVVKSRRNWRQLRLDAELALETYPLDITLNLALAQAHIMGEEEARGLPLLDKILKLGPTDPVLLTEVHALQGYALGRQGRQAESAAAFAQGLELDPSSPYLLALRALEALMRTPPELAAAQADVQRAQREDAALPEVRLASAKLALVNQKPADAMTALAPLVQDSADPQAWELQGDALLAAAKPAEARAAWQTALQAASLVQKPRIEAKISRVKP